MSLDRGDKNNGKRPRSDQNDGDHNVAARQIEIADQYVPLIEQTVQLGDDRLLSFQFGEPVQSIFQGALNTGNNIDVPLSILKWSLIVNLHVVCLKEWNVFQLILARIRVCRNKLAIIRLH